MAEAAFVIKTEEEIEASFITTLVARSERITDTTEGSIARSLAEAVGMVLSEMYVDAYLGFRRNLRDVRETVFQFARKQGSLASTTVVFTRDDTSLLESYPSGIVVATAGGIEFSTQSLMLIPAGESTSDPVAVSAVDIGRSGNVGAGEIDTIVDEDDFPNLLSVTNNVAASGGTEAETEFDFAERFQVFIEGLGRSNVAGLRTAALSFEEVRSAAVTEHIPPQTFTGILHNVSVYIDDRTVAGVSQEVIEAVQAKIDGDDVTPGYRSAGIRVRVAKPTTVTANVELTISVVSGSNQQNIMQQITDTVTSFVNSLEIGENLIRRRLYKEIFRVVGLVDVEIDSPSNNIIVSNDEVLRAGTVDITVNV